ncbi:MAG: DUF4403 family protein [Bacteroidota bacterium]
MKFFSPFRRGISGGEGTNNRLNLKYGVTLFILSLLLLTSCKTIAPPAPEIQVGTYTPPVQEVSLLTIPVEMEMKSYFQEADKSVPYEFSGSHQQCEDVSYAYKFIRNPIRIEGNPKKADPLEVGITIDGSYSLNLNYCVKCSDLFSNSPACLTPRIYASCGIGEPMRKIKVEYETAIELQPDFKLDARTRLKDVVPKDKCQITVFSYDATSQVIKEVKGALKDVSKEIDRGIEDLEIRGEVNKIWQSFVQPISLNGYGFLNVNPEKIGVGNLRLKDTRLSFETVIEAFPTVTSSKSTAPPKILPDLSPIRHDEGFNINLDLMAGYDSLSAILNRELNGKTVQIKRNKITFRDAKIFGAANQQLSIEVSFTGSKSGKLFFLGTPKFNDSLQEISFPDLTFELETKNALLRSAKWLFNDKITNVMRGYAKFNMTDILKNASQKLEQQLNRKIDENIYIKGSMNEVRVKKIFPDVNKLIIQSNLRGKLYVIIE